MQIIIDYFISNYQWLLPIILSVVEFLLLFFFRRSKLIDPSLWSEVVQSILTAEKMYGSGHGELKFKYVFDFIKSKHPIWSDSIIRAVIEKVLETPQKKGV